MDKVLITRNGRSYEGIFDSEVSERKLRGKKCLWFSSFFSRYTVITDKWIILNQRKQLFALLLLGIRCLWPSIFYKRVIYVFCCTFRICKSAKYTRKSSYTNNYYCIKILSTLSATIEMRSHDGRLEDSSRYIQILLSIQKQLLI